MKYINALLQKKTATVEPCLTGLLIFRGKKSKISRDFQGQIRGKTGRFRGIFAGEKSKFMEKSADYARFLREKSQISKDFQGQILRKIDRFHRKFRGKLCQETISKKKPISLDFFWQISLNSINFASI